jgi:hypothetical protein
VSPLKISILLHYYCSPSDFRDGDFDAPAVREAIDDFLAAGLLERSEELGVNYRATEATRIFVEAVCALPAPMLRWVMP